MFEQFAKPTRAAVTEAVRTAQAQVSPSVGCHHLLIGLATTGEPTLAALGITGETLTDRSSIDPDASAWPRSALTLRQSTSGRPPTSASRPGRTPIQGAGAPGSGGKTARGAPAFHPAAKKCLELALREAVAESSREITGTHLLRRLLGAPGDDIGRLIDQPTQQELAIGPNGRPETAPSSLVAGSMGP